MVEVEYDSGVLTRYATWLYAQSYLIVLIWTIMGVGVGAIIHAILPALLARSHNDQSVLGECLWIASSVVGLLIGCARCLEPRIKAQVMLCQVEIESNTRALAQPKIERRRIA